MVDITSLGTYFVGGATGVWVLRSALSDVGAKVDACRAALELHVTKDTTEFDAIKKDTAEMKKEIAELKTKTSLFGWLKQ